MDHLAGLRAQLPDHFVRHEKPDRVPHLTKPGVEFGHSDYNFIIIYQTCGRVGR